MMSTANMSGYSAKTPGAFMIMWFLQNISICFPMSSSNVALQARATLDVPNREISRQKQIMLISRNKSRNLKRQIKYQSLDKR